MLSLAEFSIVILVLLSEKTDKKTHAHAYFHKLLLTWNKGTNILNCAYIEEEGGGAISDFTFKLNSPSEAINSVNKYSGLWFN